MGDREAGGAGGGADKNETGAVITPKFAFGINSAIQHNLAYSDDHKFMFPVGRHIACFDFQSREMTFLLNNEKVEEVRLLRTSHDYAHMAVVETLEDSDTEQISIYKLDTDKRMKTIHLDASLVMAKKILNVDFSADGKLLMVQCAEPDYTLLVYRWFAGKLLAQSRPDFAVLGASVCPDADTMQIVIRGEHRARVLVHDPQTDQLKAQNLQGAIQKVSPTEMYVSHTWLAGGLLALATNTGTIFLAEDGEVTAKVKTEGDRLIGIHRCGLGFVGVTDDHCLLLYESPEGLQTTQVSNSQVSKGKKASKDTKDSKSTNKIFSLRTKFVTGVSSRLQCLAVSPNEESLVLSSNEAEILHLPFDDLSFWGDDVGPHVFNKMWQGFHQGNIVGVDLCRQLPYAVTAGSDKVLKVWNYETWDCLVHRQLMDHIWSISIHPSGNCVAVGMTDKLRVYTILKDDVLEIVALPVRKCDVVKYSNGGKFFAAVNSRTNNIQVYDSYTYALVATLQGHMSGVASISWSLNDTVMVSTGSGGALYRWDAVKMERLRDADHVDKAHSFTSIQMDSKGNTSLARTDKGRLVTISKEGVPIFETQTLHGENPLMLLAGDRIVLAPTKRGSVITYSWPKSYPAHKDFDPTQYSTEYKIHKGSITAAAVSADGRKMLTCSEDGVMFVSNLRFVVDGSAVDPPPEPVAPFPKVCQVLEENQQELLMQLSDLQAQLKRGKEDTEYQVMMQTQKLKEELTVVVGERNKLEENIEKFRQEVFANQSEAARDAEDRMHELEKSHMSAAEALENMYERRLLVEVDKYNRLHAVKDDIQYESEERMHALEQAHKKVMQELTHDYEARMKAQLERIGELEELNGELQSFYDEYIRQQEVDYEQVHDKQQSSFDAERQKLTQEKLRMKTEALMMRTQVEKIKKNMEREEELQGKLRGEKDVLAKNLREQKDICGMMEQEVQERNNVIQQNYITIQELRHKVRDLEMYKFVLGHKAEELSEQIEPTRRELKHIKDEMGMQDGELESRAVTNQRLKHTILERDANITSLKNELFQARTTLHSTERQMDTFVVELDRAMNLKSMPDKPGRLSDRDRALQKIYRGYVLKTQALETQEETTAELQRQNMITEKKSSMLERRVSKIETERQRKEKMRLEENSVLLRENTELSRANANLRSEVRELKNRIDDLKPRSPMSSLSRANSERFAGVSPDHQDGGPGGSPAGRPMTGPPGSRRANGPGGGGFPLPVSRGGAGSGGFGLRAAREPVSANRPAGPRTLRTAGGAGLNSKGGLLRGSPVRILNDLVGAERENTMSLAQQLETSNALVERQRLELQELRAIVRDSVDGDGGGFGVPPLFPGGSPPGVIRPSGGTTSSRFSIPSGGVAAGRPGTASAGLNSIGVEADAFPSPISGRSRVVSSAGGSVTAEDNDDAGVY